MFTGLHLIIGAVLASLLVGGIGYSLHSIDVDRLERKKVDAVAAQKTLDTNQCNADKAKTQGANHDLQINLNAVRTELDRLKRVQPAKCVPIAGTASKTGIAGLHGKHAEQNDQGIRSEWLLDYGAQCESIRISYNVCKKFVDDVWSDRVQ